MAEFKRSRLLRNSDDDISKKTISLGLLTILLFGLIVVFGLPLLVKFSILLGEAKNKKNDEVVEKVLPPMIPRLILPFEATNSSRISISGVADPGVTVELLKNDVSLSKVKTTESGDFVIPDVDLETGENIFNAIAVADKGGSSELTKPLKVIFDDQAPEIILENPKTDTLSVDSADYTVLGKSEKGVSVTVSGRLAMVDDNGNFKLKVQLSIGKNELEIVVVDPAGNEVRKIVTIVYDI